MNAMASVAASDEAAMAGLKTNFCAAANHLARLFTDASKASEKSYSRGRADAIHELRRWLQDVSVAQAAAVARGAPAGGGIPADVLHARLDMMAAAIPPDAPAPMPEADSATGDTDSESPGDTPQ
eukprot:gene3336-636_t